MKPAKSEIGEGSIVVLYLTSPSGKVWGLLRSIDQVGVAIEGIDLRAFDDCLRGIASGDLAAADLSLAFYPLARVEKILLDRASADVPSLHDQFRARVGSTIQKFLGAGGKRR